jgi:hypothetical protein
MRVRVVIALIVLIHGLTLNGQSTTNGKATASGECSVAHSGNNDTITIKNCGIGEEQGDRIIKMLNQLVTASDINAKLDQLLAIVGVPIKLFILPSGPVSVPPGTNPRTAYTFYTDGPDDRGQLELACDRACTPIEACTLQGSNTTKLATVSDIPNLAEFLFLRQFPPLTQCTLTVESRDSNPVKVLNIGPSRRLDLVPNAIQPHPFVKAGNGGMGI